MIVCHYFEKKDQNNCLKAKGGFPISGLKDWKTVNKRLRLYLHVEVCVVNNAL